MLPQLQLAGGRENCRVESAERGEGYRGRDVRASPGATGTHTLPLASPRETERATVTGAREIPGHVLALNITSVHCLPLSTYRTVRSLVVSQRVQVERGRSSVPRKNADICGDGSIYIV